MHRINGPTDLDLARFEDRAEAAMTEALQQVMDTIADRVGHVQVAAGKTLWAGCHYCLNPRHPGRCAKPGSKAYEKRHGKAKKPPGGGGEGGPADEGGAAKFKARASTAATGPAAQKAAPFNRETGDDRLEEGFDDFEDTGVSGSRIGDALADYGGNGHASVNGALRTNGGDPANLPESLPGVLGYSHGRVSDQITGLDAVMSRSKLTSDVVVHRGVGNTEKLFGTSGDLTGMQFRDHGYVSTTTSGHASGEFTGNKTGLQMRILVPAGTGALGSDALDRNELLLDRGLNFQIVRDYQSDGVRTVDVEVLP